MQEFEEGYCSHCFKKSKHILEEKNYLRRNIYKCSNCGATTLQCRFCSNFARSGEYWDDELCAEHAGEIASFKTLDKKLEEIEDYNSLFERESINIKKVATVGVAAVGAVAVVGPLVFVAAPAVGGAIGSLMGLSGAAATNAGLAFIGGGAMAAGGLGMAGGAAILTATGVALGGTLGGVVSNNYFGDIDNFDIKKVKDGKGKPVIFIDGFLTQKNDDINTWQEQLKELYPNNPWYYVSWESKRLYDIGKLFVNLTSKEAIGDVALKLAKTATKEGAKKLGPLNNVLTLLGLFNNPWSIAMVKAAETGVLLADILARTNKEYILCGHSLGARVIFYTLEALSTKEKQYINSVHLLGGAVGSNKQDWEIAKKAVSSKIYNYKSSNDYVLASFYKVGTFFTSAPIGRNDINVNGVENIDVSDIVGRHSEYKKNFAKFAKVDSSKGFFGKIFG